MIHPALTSIGTALIAAGLIVGVVALVALHVLPTGLSPIRNPVSQYGISSYRAGYRIQTIAYALAGLGAAVGIATLPGTPALTVVLCAVFAASRAAISWFPMDAPGATPTSRGGQHRLLAMVAFLSVALAATALPRALHQAHADGRIATLSGALAVVMFIALIAMAVDRRAGGGHFGLIERVFYLGMTTWFGALAILLATASG